MANRMANRRLARQARAHLNQDLSREDLENLNQQLLARRLEDQRQRALERQQQADALALAQQAMAALEAAETAPVPALSNTAQNGGRPTLPGSGLKMARLPRNPSSPGSPAGLDGFASVGASAAAAYGALARTRAIMQQKRQEQLEAQQRAYQDLLARFQGACARCFDTGQVWESSQFCDCERGLERLQAAQARTVARILEAAQVPPEYSQAYLTAFPRQNVARALEAWAQDQAQQTHRQGLVLTGPIGVGKTSLLAAALRRLVELDVARDLSTPLRYRFRDTADWLVQLRAGMDDGTYADLMGEAQTYGLWVLDDLGRTPYTPWEQGQLWGAIKSRCDAHRPVFATTNLTPDELAARLSPAVLDRLQASCLWVTVTGKSMRRARSSLAF